MPITFKAASVEKTHHWKESKVNVGDVKQHPGQHVYRSSGTELVHVPFGNGFIGTVYQAYSYHYNLSLSPDHVWCAIMHAFNTYMNSCGKAESLRDKFVMHEGKKTLSVGGVGTLSTVDWGELVEKMSTLIDENTRPGTVQWVEPSFSTTSATDRLVGKAMLMSVLQKFFEYRFYQLCGIPNITLEGTVEDWVNIRERVDRLDELGLAEWKAKLVPVLDQFVDSAKGKPDIEFWSKICHKQSWGSGAPQTFLGGWINVFCPFRAHVGYILPPGVGDYGNLDIRDVPAGTMTVPFILDDNGVEQKLEFCCGFFGATMPDSNTLRPSLDWSIRDPSKEREGRTG